MSMKMDTELLNKMIHEINDVKLREQQAKNVHAGEARAKENAKNLMYNYWNEIKEVIGDYLRMKEENESMAAELDKQDKEMAALRKEAAGVKKSK